MRDIDNVKRGRRKRRRSGCGGCFVNIITFGIIFAILCVVGYKLFTESDLSKRLLALKYPINYEEYVLKSANEFSLDKDLVYAVIRTESKFDPYAVSATDARGLMQIQDETARDCVKKLGIKNYTTDMLFEPDINIRIGCYYLNKLIKKYNGSTKLALAAYNGGPGNVDKWLKDETLTDENDNLIHIPFKETREYVEKVFKAKDIYEKIYTEINN